MGAIGSGTGASQTEPIIPPDPQSLEYKLLTQLPLDIVYSRSLLENVIIAESPLYPEGTILIRDPIEGTLYNTRIGKLVDDINVDHLTDDEILAGIKRASRGLDDLLTPSQRMFPGPAHMPAKDFGGTNINDWQSRTPQPVENAPGFPSFDEWLRQLRAQSKPQARPNPLRTTEGLRSLAESAVKFGYMLPEDIRRYDLESEAGRTSMRRRLDAISENPAFAERETAMRLERRQALANYAKQVIAPVLGDDEKYYKRRWVDIGNERYIELTYQHPHDESQNWTRLISVDPGLKPGTVGRGRIDDQQIDVVHRLGERIIDPASLEAQRDAFARVIAGNRDPMQRMPTLSSEHDEEVPRGVRQNPEMIGMQGVGLRARIASYFGADARVKVDPNYTGDQPLDIRDSDQEYHRSLREQGYTHIASPEQYYGKDFTIRGPNSSHLIYTPSMGDIPGWAITRSGDLLTGESDPLKAAKRAQLGDVQEMVGWGPRPGVIGSKWHEDPIKTNRSGLTRTGYALDTVTVFGGMGLGSGQSLLNEETVGGWTPWERTTYRVKIAPNAEGQVVLSDETRAALDAGREVMRRRGQTIDINGVPVDIGGNWDEHTYGSWRQEGDEIIFEDVIRSGNAISLKSGRKSHAVVSDFRGLDERMRDADLIEQFSGDVLQDAAAHFGAMSPDEYNKAIDEHLAKFRELGQYVDFDPHAHDRYDEQLSPFLLDAYRQFVRENIDVAQVNRVVTASELHTLIKEDRERLAAFRQAYGISPEKLPSVLAAAPRELSDGRYAIITNVAFVRDKRLTNPRVEQSRDTANLNFEMLTGWAANIQGDTSFLMTVGAKRHAAYLQVARAALVGAGIGSAEGLNVATLEQASEEQAQQYLQAYNRLIGESGEKPTQAEMQQARMAALQETFGDTMLSMGGRLFASPNAMGHFTATNEEGDEASPLIRGYVNLADQILNSRAQSLDYSDAEEQAAGLVGKQYELASTPGFRHNLLGVSSSSARNYTYTTEEGVAANEQFMHFQTIVDMEMARAVEQGAADTPENRRWIVRELRRLRREGKPMATHLTVRLPSSSPETQYSAVTNVYSEGVLQLRGSKKRVRRNGIIQSEALTQAGGGDTDADRATQVTTSSYQYDEKGAITGRTMLEATSSEAIERAAAEHPAGELGTLVDLWNYGEKAVNYLTKKPAVLSRREMSAGNAGRLFQAGIDIGATYNWWRMAQATMIAHGDDQAYSALSKFVAATYQNPLDKKPVSEGVRQLMNVSRTNLVTGFYGPGQSLTGMNRNQKNRSDSFAIATTNLIQGVINASELSPELAADFLSSSNMGPEERAYVRQQIEAGRAEGANTWSIASDLQVYLNKMAGGTVEGQSHSYYALGNAPAAGLLQMAAHKTVQKGSQFTNNSLNDVLRQAAPMGQRIQDVTALLSKDKQPASRMARMLVGLGGRLFPETGRFATANRIFNRLLSGLGLSGLSLSDFPGARNNAASEQEAMLAAQPVEPELLTQAPPEIVEAAQAVTPIAPEIEALPTQPSIPTAELAAPAPAATEPPPAISEPVAPPPAPATLPLEPVVPAPTTPEPVPAAPEPATPKKRARYKHPQTGKFISKAAWEALQAQSRASAAPVAPELLSPITAAVTPPAPELPPAPAQQVQVPSGAAQPTVTRPKGIDLAEAEADLAEAGEIDEKYGPYEPTAEDLAVVDEMRAEAEEPLPMPTKQSVARSALQEGVSINVADSKTERRTPVPPGGSRPPLLPGGGQPPMPPGWQSSMLWDKSSGMRDVNIAKWGGVRVTERNFSIPVKIMKGAKEYTAHDKNVIIGAAERLRSAPEKLTAMLTKLELGEQLTPEDAREFDKIDKDLRVFSMSLSGAIQAQELGISNEIADEIANTYMGGPHDPVTGVRTGGTFWKETEIGQVDEMLSGEIGTRLTKALANVPRTSRGQSTGKSAKPELGADDPAASIAHDQIAIFSAAKRLRSAPEKLAGILAKMERGEELTSEDAKLFDKISKDRRTFLAGLSGAMRDQAAGTSNAVIEEIVNAFLGGPLDPTTGMRTGGTHWTQTEIGQVNEMLSGETGTRLAEGLADIPRTSRAKAVDKPTKPELGTDDPTASIAHDKLAIFSAAKRLRSAPEKLASILAKMEHGEELTSEDAKLFDKISKDRRTFLTGLASAMREQAAGTSSAVTDEIVNAFLGGPLDPATGERTGGIHWTQTEIGQVNEMLSGETGTRLAEGLADIPRTARSSRGQSAGRPPKPGREDLGGADLAANVDILNKSFSILRDTMRKLTEQSGKLSKEQAAQIEISEKAFNQIRDRVREARANPEDPNNAKFLAAYEEAGGNAWLRQIGNALYGRDIEGKSLAQRVRTARNVDGFFEPEADQPSLMEKFQPFLQHGRAGQAAMRRAIEKGWYGEEGSLKFDAAMALGRTLAVPAQMISQGYNIRRFQQEFIDPLLGARQEYLQYQAGIARAQIGTDFYGGMSGVGMEMYSQAVHPMILQHNRQLALGRATEHSIGGIQDMLTGWLGTQNVATGQATIQTGMMGAAALGLLTGWNPIAVGIGAAAGLGASFVGQIHSYETAAPLEAVSRYLDATKQRDFGAQTGRLWQLIKERFTGDSSQRVWIEDYGDTINDMIDKGLYQTSQEYPNRVRKFLDKYGREVRHQIDLYNDPLLRSNYITELFKRNQERYKYLKDDQRESIAALAAEIGWEGAWAQPEGAESILKTADILGRGAAAGVDVMGDAASLAQIAGLTPENIASLNFQQQLFKIGEWYGDQQRGVYYQRVIPGIMKQIGQVVEAQRAAGQTPTYSVDDVRRIADQKADIDNNPNLTPAQKAEAKRQIDAQFGIDMTQAGYAGSSLIFSDQGAGGYKAYLEALNKSGKVNELLAGQQNAGTVAGLANAMIIGYDVTTQQASSLATLFQKVSPFASSAQKSAAFQWMSEFGQKWDTETVDEAAISNYIKQATRGVNPMNMVEALAVAGNVRVGSPEWRALQTQQQALFDKSGEDLPTYRAMEQDARVMAQYNQMARLGGLKTRTLESFEGAGPQNQQLVLNAEQAVINVKAITGLSAETGAYMELQRRAQTAKTDEQIFEANRQIVQYGQAMNYLESKAAYNTTAQLSDYRSMLERAATSMSGPQFQALMARIGGDPIALSQYVANQGMTAQNQYLYSVQTGRYGGTKGMEAGYDEEIQAPKRQAYMQIDTKFGGIGAKYAQLAGMDYSKISGMNMVETQAQIATIQFDLEQYQYQMQTQQLARRRAFMTGEGLAAQAGAIRAAGGGQYVADAIASGGEWALQDAQRRLSWRQQDYQYEMQGRELGISQARFALQGQQFNEQFGLRQRQLAMQTAWQEQEMTISQAHARRHAEWQMQDLQYSRARSEISFGWQMEDFDRNIRYARGRERVDLMRERERAVISHAMEAGQNDREQARAREQRTWQEESFARERAHFAQTKQWQQESLNMERQHFEQHRALEAQSMQLQRQKYEQERQFIMQNRELEMKSRALSRAEALVDLKQHEEMMKRSHDAQVQIAALNQHLTDMSRAANEANKYTQYQARTGELLPKVVQAMREYNNALHEAVNHLRQGVAAARQVTQAENAAAIAISRHELALSRSSATPARSPAAARTYSLGGEVLPSFGAGGYTGTGHRYEPAGVVEAGEYVVPQDGALVVRGSDKETVTVLREAVTWLKKIAEAGRGNLTQHIYTNDVRSATKTGLDIYDKAFARKGVN
jgi:hypothetical protein